MRQRVNLWKRSYDTDDNSVSKALSQVKVGSDGLRLRGGDAERLSTMRTFVTPKKSAGP